MKFIIRFAAFLMCYASLQIDAMFNCTIPMTIKATQELEIKLENLAHKTPRNTELSIYLQSIRNQNLDKDNCYERQRMAQTLLFPLNTHLRERVWNASQQNLPEISYLNPLQWHKKPIAQACNMMQEGSAIISDTFSSLRISDAVAVALGYICAEGVVRRVGNESSTAAALLAPLYVAGPLAALWIKKCRFDNRYSYDLAKQHLAQQQANENIVRDVLAQNDVAQQRAQFHGELTNARRALLEESNDALRVDGLMQMREINTLRNENANLRQQAQAATVHIPGTVGNRSLQAPSFSGGSSSVTWDILHLPKRENQQKSDDQVLGRTLTQNNVTIPNRSDLLIQQSQDLLLRSNIAGSRPLYQAHNVEQPELSSHAGVLGSRITASEALKGLVGVRKLCLKR